jgi:hypothetical protein
VKAGVGFTAEIAGDAENTKDTESTEKMKEYREE